MVIWPGAPWPDRILYWGFALFLLALVDFGVTNGRTLFALVSQPKQFASHVIRGLLSGLPRYAAYALIVAAVGYILEFAVMNIVEVLKPKK